MMLSDYIVLVQIFDRVQYKSINESTAVDCSSASGTDLVGCWTYAYSCYCLDQSQPARSLRLGSF